MIAGIKLNTDSTAIEMSDGANCAHTWLGKVHLYIHKIDDPVDAIVFSPTDWLSLLVLLLYRTDQLCVRRTIDQQVMTLARVNDPGSALIALSECRGNACLAARRISEDRHVSPQL